MHVFLSYARSSAEQAACVEQVLREEGYVVWRDTELPAHLSYADVIEERLRSAKAVLVLWSAEAAKSQWVRAEADAARELGTLIQSSVDGTIPPIPFNQIQCADLKHWSGQNDHPGWRKLHASILALAGQAEEPVKAARHKRRTSSICVLPFQNMSGDAVPDYFCDGLSEDIITDLSKVRGLSVAPRNAAFQFKGQQEDAASVAERLDVSYVFEGTVRRAGERVRITAQLVDGSTGEQVWSDRYYREFTDVFAVQDEMVQAIVAALKARLVPSEQKATEGAELSAEADDPKGEELARGERSPAVETLAEAEVEQRADGEPELVQETARALEVADFHDDHFANASYANESWAAEEAWDSSEEEYGGEWSGRGRKPRGLTAPRLIALGLALLLAVILFRVFLWSDRSAAVAQKEEVIAYTVTSTVNVRSRPSRTNSRILGTLEVGATFNIVPALAGAQPDWLKINDGPYLGGYVWRESTRPASEAAASSAPGAGETRPGRKAVTG